MNYYNITTQISYDKIKLTNVTESKFLGLIINSTLSWKQHTDYIIKKISIAFYALRNIKYFILLDTLKLIYFAHIHSIISYGIIVLYCIVGGVGWDGSSCVNKVLIMQKKKAIRIVTNSRPKESCRDLFKNSKIMTFFSQYIYSIALFIINNDHLFNSNNEIHRYRTRAHCNLHLPAVNLTKYSKGAYILATDEASFKHALKRFFISAFLLLYAGILSTQLALSM
jgi:hypothetical protein